MKNHSVKIGNKTIPHGLFLAPMAGFTDAPFRHICHTLGAEYSVTEMISAKAVCHSDKKTFSLASLPHEALPVAIQIFGHWPSDMTVAAQRLIEGAKAAGGDMPAAIDINMGCPVKKIFSSGDGSALMANPLLCAKLVEATKKGIENSGLDIPVTVKIRAGIDAEHRNAVEVAQAAVQAGAAAVFVHGRTRTQFYAPSSSNDIIAAVREALPPEIAVIGNGDVTDVESALRMFDETGCDGIMIGRQSLGDPWIFGRIIAALDGKEYTEPTERERAECALGLCREVCRIYGEGAGVPMCRGRAGHFIRGMRGAAVMRDALCHAKTLAEIEDILTNFG